MAGDFAFPDEPVGFPIRDAEEVQAQADVEAMEAELARKEKEAADAKLKDAEAGGDKASIAAAAADAEAAERKLKWEAAEAEAAAELVTAREIVDKLKVEVHELNGRLAKVQTKAMACVDPQEREVLQAEMNAKEQEGDLFRTKLREGYDRVKEVQARVTALQEERRQNWTIKDEVEHLKSEVERTNTALSKIQEQILASTDPLKSKQMHLEMEKISNEGDTFRKSLRIAIKREKVEALKSELSQLQNEMLTVPRPKRAELKAKMKEIDAEMQDAIKAYKATAAD